MQQFSFTNNNSSMLKDKNFAFNHNAFVYFDVRYKFQSETCFCLN